MIGEKIVEILERRVLDFRSFGNAGIGDENVEPFAHDSAHILGELVWCVGLGEIGGKRFGAAASLADFRNDGFGFVRRAAIMHKNLRALPGECEGAGAADTARGARDERGLTGQIAHGLMSFPRVNAGAFFDRIDAIGIKGNVIRDDRHCRMRMLIAPDGIDRLASAGRDGEIARVAFVRAIGRVLCRL